jgi:hypothetical protein
MKAILSKLRILLAAAWSLVYPPTKAKFHRLLHIALTALAVGASVVLWIQGHHWGWSTWDQIEAQAVLLGTFIARAKLIVQRLDKSVDSLPIPDGAAPQPTTEPTPVTVANPTGGQSSAKKGPTP